MRVIPFPLLVKLEDTDRYCNVAALPASGPISAAPWRFYTLEIFDRNKDGAMSSSVVDGDEENIIINMFKVPQYPFAIAGIDYVIVVEIVWRCYFCLSLLKPRFDVH